LTFLGVALKTLLTKIFRLTISAADPKGSAAVFLTPGKKSFIGGKSLVFIFLRYLL
jgi:hypothetical protein